jgi:hypothetical protein
MALVSQTDERSWATDKYGDQVLSWKWDWRDARIMAWINNFTKISRQNVMANVGRLDMTRSGALKRSLAWKTWAASGGDAQVFEARYIYYAKFVELAVGKGEPYDSPVPDIPGPLWRPIKVPSRSRKGKPHVVTELRQQASRFSSMARKHFSFVGTVFLVYAMGNNQSAAAAVNRALFWAARRGKTER